MPVQSAIEKISVLGLPVACVDYASGLEETQRLIRLERPTAVSACNTHIIAAVRSNPSFSDIMLAFDLILPDGMPVVWLMNHRGAGLEDRVYGPYFMRYAIERSPVPWRHFFIGSTESCLAELAAEAKKLQPNLIVTGTYSPPFRERFSSAAPAWQQSAIPLIALHHRLRRAFRGVYRQAPFDYAIYTREHPSQRTLFSVTNPTTLWKERFTLLR